MKNKVCPVLVYMLPTYMKMALWFTVVLIVLSVKTGRAQTHLATRGNEQLLKGNTLFTMQDQVDYRVIGVSSWPGGILIETSIGPVEFKEPRRFRVLPGGKFAENLTIALKDVAAKLIDDPGTPSTHPNYGDHQFHGLPEIGRPAFSGARYEAQLISPSPMAHVFVAFQWYVDNKPVGTNIQTIGNVPANSPVIVSCEIPLEASQKVGTYTIHVYSGYYEVKHLDTTKAQDDRTAAKQGTDAW